MKTKVLIFVLAISTIIISCEKHLAVFTESQPVKVNTIKEIPNNLLGYYINIENNQLIKIEKNNIIKRQTILDSINKKDYSTLNQFDKEGYKSISDTLFIKQFEIVDTIFDFKKNDILKKYKGSYYLNRYYEDSFWAVSRLQFKKNYIILSEIENESDINLLDELTNQNNKDSIYPKSFKLDKKQFKEFVKRNGFSENEIFIKQ